MSTKTALASDTISQGQVTNAQLVISEEIDVRLGLDGHGLSETIPLWTPIPGKKVLTAWYTPYKNIGDLGGFAALTLRNGSEVPGGSPDAVFVEYNASQARSLGIRVHALVEA
jgi:hypothetical protein